MWRPIVGVEPELNLRNNYPVELQPVECGVFFMILRGLFPSRVHSSISLPMHRNPLEDV
jgi:hypothetical protein